MSSNRKYWSPLLLAVMAGASAFAEPTSPVDPLVPKNPAFADSTWPIYHSNSYATACVVDRLATPYAVESVDNLTFRRFGKGPVSPWTVLRAPEANGDQVVLTSPLPGVAKYIIKNNKLTPVSFLKLERDWMDFDWTIGVLPDGSCIVTERRHNRYVIVGDSGASPESPLKVLRTIPIDAQRYGEISMHFTLAYDGTLMGFNLSGQMLAVDVKSGKVLDVLDLPTLTKVFHNSFPIDETGRLFISTQDALMAVDWDGRKLRKAWVAEYDMRGPGFENVQEGKRTHLKEALAVRRGDPGTGTGTTPTLLGSPSDGVVVLVDGHSPQNHLVAFWRDQIPADWRALPDPNRPGQKLDRRVAGVLALPHSTPDGEGYTAENSPAALGNSVVIAQWAGFAPDETPPKGVQRVDWNPQTRKLELVWANAGVLINGVPTIGMGSNGPIVLGMGREGRQYVYQTLDLETGKLLSKLTIGTDDDVLDQGNNNIIAADGSVIYPGKRSLQRFYDPAAANDRASASP